MNLNSVSDMTQGDFLGSEDVKPDFYYNKGVSLLLIYTPKGKIFLKTLKKNFDLLISNASECTKKQPRVSFARGFPCSSVMLWAVTKTAYFNLYFAIFSIF